MPICLAAGTAAVTLAVQQFTLAWTHSIEKTRWEEDWRTAGAQLVIDEARIAGSGAGMEPPPGATLRRGIWHYRPVLPAQETLQLRHSPHALPYQLCVAGQCSELAGLLPGIGPEAVITLRSCP